MESNWYSVQADRLRLYFIVAEREDARDVARAVLRKSLAPAHKLQRVDAPAPGALKPAFQTAGGIQVFMDGSL